MACCLQIVRRGKQPARVVAQPRIWYRFSFQKKNLGFQIRFVTFRIISWGKLICGQKLLNQSKYAWNKLQISVFISCFKMFKGSLANVRLGIDCHILVRMLTAAMDGILILGLRPSVESSIGFLGWFGLGFWFFFL